MQVNDTQQAAVWIHHRERRDFLLFHDAERCGGKFVRGIVFGSRVMHFAGGEVERIFSALFNRRRRSPSLMIPTSLSPSATAVTPSFLRDIS